MDSEKIKELSRSLEETGADIERQNCRILRLLELQKEDPERRLYTDVKVWSKEEPQNQPTVICLSLHIGLLVQAAREEMWDLLKGIIVTCDEIRDLASQSLHPPRQPEMPAFKPEEPLQSNPFVYNGEPLPTKVPDKIELPIGKPLVGAGRTE